jgi:hypothetical protein
MENISLVEKKNIKNDYLGPKQHLSSFGPNSFAAVGSIIQHGKWE